MVNTLHNRTEFAARARDALRDDTLLEAATNRRQLPKPLVEWLAKLRLLKGVPFSYLVPDEGLLPPESIRFFVLDPAWIAAMVDGALSIGRNLSNDEAPPLAPMEAAIGRHVAPLASAALPNQRARKLGLAARPLKYDTVSGFVLRSSIVSGYKGLGVNVFPKGHTPADHTRDPKIEIELLDILRFEALGAQSDVLLCLVAGEAWRVDIHEAPEGLHFGIDAYQFDHGGVTAHKNAHAFTKSGDTVTLSEQITKVSLNNAFRPGAPRVMKMARAAQNIADAIPGISVLDAAEFGFEMTQGVGMVSFVKGAST